MAPSKHAPRRLSRTGGDAVMPSRTEMRAWLLLALFFALHEGRAFFLPVVVALLLHFLLSPVVRTLSRARIPEPVGAAVVLSGLLVAVGLAGYYLAGPTREWLAQAPASVSQTQARIRRLLKPVAQVTRTAEQVAQRWQVRSKHVYTLAREGSVPHVRIGRYVRFRLEAIEQWERQQEVATHA